MDEQEQQEKEYRLLLTLVRETGVEVNANGTTTANRTEAQHLNGFRANHHPDLIRDAANGDIAALAQLRRDCGLPIFI